MEEGKKAGRQFQDNIAPTVSISAPAQDATVSGTVTLTASASDNVAISSVQFRVDSENRCIADTSSPYTCDWITGQEGNGSLTLTALAIDASGNRAISDPVTVTVDNFKNGGSSAPSHPVGTIRVPEDHATIQGAVDAAGDGDLVLVGPGNYSGGITISGKSITLASHYHITGKPSFIDKTTIDGGSPGIHITSTASGTLIKGFRFTGGKKAVQLFSHGSVIANQFHNTEKDAISFEDVGGSAIGNECFATGDDCIDVDHPTSDVLIENNIMNASQDDGIEIRNGKYSGALVTITIRGNTIAGSGEDGIQLIDYMGNSNRRFIIERNLIRNSVKVGLGLMDQSETLEDYRAANMANRIHVFGNTFDGNSYGITGGDNLIAVNNIISNSSVLGIKNIDNHSIVAHTLFWNNAAHHAGSNLYTSTAFFGNPLFTTSFELQKTSPAIDSGTARFVHKGETVLTIPSSDYSGKAPDLGRQEFIVEDR